MPGTVTSGRLRDLRREVVHQAHSRSGSYAMRCDTCGGIGAFGRLYRYTPIKEAEAGKPVYRGLYCGVHCCNLKRNGSKEPTDGR